MPNIPLTVQANVDEAKQKIDDLKNYIKNTLGQAFKDVSGSESAQAMQKLGQAITNLGAGENLKGIAASLRTINGALKQIQETDISSPIAKLNELKQALAGLPQSVSVKLQLETPGAPALSTPLASTGGLVDQFGRAINQPTARVTGVRTADAEQTRQIREQSRADYERFQAAQRASAKATADAEVAAEIQAQQAKLSARNAYEQQVKNLGAEELRAEKAKLDEEYQLLQQFLKLAGSNRAEAERIGAQIQTNRQQVAPIDTRLGTLDRSAATAEATRSQALRIQNEREYAQILKTLTAEELRAEIAFYQKRAEESKLTLTRIGNDEKRLAEETIRLRQAQARAGAAQTTLGQLQGSQSQLRVAAVRGAPVTEEFINTASLNAAREKVRQTNEFIAASSKQAADHMKIAFSAGFAAISTGIPVVRELGQIILGFAAGPVGGAITAAIVGLQGIARAGEAWVGFIKEGITVSALFEERQLAIQALLAQNYRFSLDAAENFKKAGVAAQQVFDELLRRAPESIGGIQQLSKAFQATIASGSAVGLGMRDAVNLAPLLVNSVALITGKFNDERQILTEINALFQGQNRAGAELLRVLTLQNPFFKEQFRLAQEQGRVYEFLRTQLSGIDQASKALGGTWEGLMTTVKSVEQRFLTATFHRSFETLKKAIQDVLDALEKNKDKIDEISRAIGHMADVTLSAVGSMVQYFGGVEGILVRIRDTIKEINRFMDTFREQEPTKTGKEFTGLEVTPGLSGLELARRELRATGNPFAPYVDKAIDYLNTDEAERKMAEAARNLMEKGLKAADKQIDTLNAENATPPVRFLLDRKIGKADTSKITAGIKEIDKALSDLEKRDETRIELGRKLGLTNFLSDTKTVNERLKELTQSTNQQTAAQAQQLQELLADRGKILTGFDPQGTKASTLNEEQLLHLRQELTDELEKRARKEDAHRRQIQKEAEETNRLASAYDQLFQSTQRLFEVEQLRARGEADQDTLRRVKAENAYADALRKVEQAEANLAEAKHNINPRNEANRALVVDRAAKLFEARKKAVDALSELEGIEAKIDARREQRLEKLFDAIEKGEGALTKAQSRIEQERDQLEADTLGRRIARIQRGNDEQIRGLEELRRKIVHQFQELATYAAIPLHIDDRAIHPELKRAFENLKAEAEANAQTLQLFQSQQAAHAKALESITPTKLATGTLPAGVFNTFLQKNLELPPGLQRFFDELNKINNKTLELSFRLFGVDEATRQLRELTEQSIRYETTLRELKNIEADHKNVLNQQKETLKDLSDDVSKGRITWKEYDAAVAEVAEEEQQIVEQSISRAETLLKTVDTHKKEREIIRQLVEDFAAYKRSKGEAFDEKDAENLREEIRERGLQSQAVQDLIVLIAQLHNANDPEKAKAEQTELEKAINAYQRNSKAVQELVKFIIELHKEAGKEIPPQIVKIIKEVSERQPQESKAGEKEGSEPLLNVPSRLKGREQTPFEGFLQGFIGSINQVIAAFQQNFVAGIGSALQAVSKFLGPVVGQIVNVIGQVFSFIGQFIGRAARKMAEQIRNEITAITRDLNFGNLGLAEAIARLEAERQSAIDRLSHKKKGRDELKKLLPQIDQELDSLRLRQRDIINRFQRDLGDLRIDRDVRSIAQAFEQLNDRIKEFLGAGGGVSDAFEFFTRSVADLRAGLQEQLDSLLQEGQRAAESADRTRQGFDRQVADEMHRFLQGAEDESGRLISLEQRAALDTEKAVKKFLESQLKRAREITKLEEELAQSRADEAKRIQDIENEGIAIRAKSTAQDKQDRIAQVQEEAARRRADIQQRLQDLKKEETEAQINHQNELDRIANRLERERQAHEERLQQINEERAAFEKQRAEEEAAYNKKLELIRRQMQELAYWSDLIQSRLFPSGPPETGGANIHSPTEEIRDTAREQLTQAKTQSETLDKQYTLEQAMAALDRQRNDYLQKLIERLDVMRQPLPAAPPAQKMGGGINGDINVNIYTPSGNPQDIAREVRRAMDEIADRYRLTI